MAPAWLSALQNITFFPPDALALFIGLILFIIVFIIFECRGIVREWHAEPLSQAKAERKTA